MSSLSYYKNFFKYPSTSAKRHPLAAYNRSEFLATPQLIRFDYVKGQDEFEPTLLIKGSTLLLKYIAQGVRMQLAFARLDDRLLYALKVYDDEEKAGILWSIVERDEEKAAISALGIVKGGGKGGKGEEGGGRG